MFELKIELTDNGWILRYRTDDGKDCSTVYAKDQGISELEAWSYLLSDLDNLAGPQTGRYDKERVYIEIRPGDKYEE